METSLSSQVRVRTHYGVPSAKTTHLPRYSAEHSGIDDPGAGQGPLLRKAIVNQVLIPLTSFSLDSLELPCEELNLEDQVEQAYRVMTIVCFWNVAHPLSECRRIAL